MLDWIFHLLDRAWVPWRRSCLPPAETSHTHSSSKIQTQTDGQQPLAAYQTPLISFSPEKIVDKETDRYYLHGVLDILMGMGLFLVTPDSEMAQFMRDFLCRKHHSKQHLIELAQQII